MFTDQKAIWQRYYKERREALISKVEDLSEYEARKPRTPTGTSLIGIIKHVLNVEAVYLGATFGRPFPHPDQLVADSAYEADPQADWYATADETAAGIIDLYRRVIAHCGRTVELLELDTVGTSATGLARRSRCTGSWCTISPTSPSTAVRPTSCANKSTAALAGDSQVTTSRTGTTGRRTSPS